MSIMGKLNEKKQTLRIRERERVGNNNNTHKVTSYQGQNGEKSFNIQHIRTM